MLQDILVIENLSLSKASQCENIWGSGGSVPCILNYFGIFNDVFNNSDCIASNEEIIGER